jgi:hypothetical protein
MDGMSEALTIYYRVTARSNNKGRPAWFSKELALRSMLVSLQESGLPYSIVYVADGGVPADLAPLIEQTGDVVPISGGSAAKAMRRLLDLLVQPAASSGSGLLWLAEDDYLYQRSAFAGLMAAYAAIPEADYLNLYTPDNAAWHATHLSQPARRGPEEERQVGDVRWHRVYDTNASFGVRREVVASDARLLRAASFSGAGWDHTMMLLTSGLRPFSWRHVLTDLHVRPQPQALARAAARPVIRTSLNLLHAARGSRAGSAWWAPVEDLSTHVEEGYLSPHWDSRAYAEQLAAETGYGTGPGGPG